MRTSPPKPWTNARILSLASRSGGMNVPVNRRRHLHLLRMCQRLERRGWLTRDESRPVRWRLDQTFYATEAGRAALASGETTSPADWRE